jgi:hypothetical protein
MPVRMNQYGCSYHKDVAHPAHATIAALYLLLQDELREKHPNKHVTCCNLAELVSTSASNPPSIIRAVKGSQIDTHNLLTMKEEMEHQLHQLPPPPLSKSEVVCWKAGKGN